MFYVVPQSFWRGQSRVSTACYMIGEHDVKEGEEAFFAFCRRFKGGGAEEKEAQTRSEVIGRGVKLWQQLARGYVHEFLREKRCGGRACASLDYWELRSGWRSLIAFHWVEETVTLPGVKGCLLAVVLVGEVAEEVGRELNTARMIRLNGRRVARKIVIFAWDRAAMEFVRRKFNLRE
jgi:hypothetical protein